MPGRTDRCPRRAGAWAPLLTLVLLAAMCGQSYGHVERASYWPDPAPDTSVSPPAGGKVPAAPRLFSALKKSPPGVTRVVCQGSVPSPRRVGRLTRRIRAAGRARSSRARVAHLRRSLKRARRAYDGRVRRNPSMRRLSRQISRARKEGFKDRPSEPARRLSRRAAARLRAFNVRLLSRCRYREIQKAVTRSRNNDRVVVMPGIYTEPTARSRPTDDKSCANLKLLNDRNNPAALSYHYHVKCPNDANLIAIAGREVGPGEDPKQPRLDRRGIPNLGACLRCNLQLEARA